MSGALLEYALGALDLGLSVVPPREDGSKRPAGTTWKVYEQHPPAEATIRDWYRNGRVGFGVVTGRVSGGLEMLELEGRAVEEGIADELDELADAAGLGELLTRIADGYCERTPSGGLHLLYRCPRVEGSLKLARREATPEELAVDPDDKLKVLIETRGEGGYTILAPSSGRVHPTERPWEIVSGGLSTIVTITEDERAALHELCRRLDRLPVARAEAAAPTPGKNELVSKLTASTPPDEVQRFLAGGSSWMDDAIADFNDQTTWENVLPAGCHFSGPDARGVVYVTRPGKAPREGHSATINSNGTDRLIVFSSSWPDQGIEIYSGNGPTTNYDRFSYAVIKTYGDDSREHRVEFARQLRPDRQPPTSGTPISAASRHDADGTATASTPPPEPWPPHLLPEPFWAERAELAHIHAAATARGVSPDAVLGAVLARVAAMSHHSLVLPAIVGGIAGLELFVAIVGASGTGKGAATAIAEELLLAPTSVNNWLAGRFVQRAVGSGEGLIKSYFGTVDERDEESGKTVRRQRQVAWNALLEIDEGEALARLAQRRDQTTTTTLRAAWSRKELGAAYSDDTKDRRLPPGSYRLGLIMGVQPSIARFLFDEAAGGTPQRFTWASATYPIPDEPGTWPGRLEWHHPRRPETRTDAHALEVCGAAKKELWQAHLARTRGDDGDPLGAHGGLRRLKVAAVLALLAERIEIDEDDWRLAGIVSSTSDAVRDRILATLAAEDRARSQAALDHAGRRRRVELEAEDEAADRRLEQCARAIVNRLRKTGPQPWRDLRDAVAGRQRHLRIPARDHALEQGWIAEGEDGLVILGPSAPGEQP